MIDSGAETLAKNGGRFSLARKCVADDNFSAFSLTCAGLVVLCWLAEGRILYERN